MKYLFLLFFTTSLFASLHNKSAVVYYGKDISYSTVGLHDYIIVQPDNVNVTRYGFKLYKDKMYAYVSIGEIEKRIPEYKYIKKEWILDKNEAWQSEVMDLKNKDYQEFLFKYMIEPRLHNGWKNFFFDTLDSYQIASKTKKQREENELALANFINEFHKRYPNSKLVVNRGFEVIDKIHDSIDAVLFESYYKGIGGKKLAYKDVSDDDRKWLDVQIDKIKSYNLDVICVDYMDTKHISNADILVTKILDKGMIPYISNRELNMYGVSSKNAIKRDILVLVDESEYDIMTQTYIVNIGTFIEYYGYKPIFYDINKGLPNIENMTQYGGVVVWLRKNIEGQIKYVTWLKSLDKINLKVAILNIFGVNPDQEILKPLNVKLSIQTGIKKNILYQDDILSYEIPPSLSTTTLHIKSKNIKELLVYRYIDDTTSTPAAITSWGGYAVGDAFKSEIDGDSLFVIEPFSFLKQSLRLKELIVPDVTTENGKRLMFTHVDGDGIMNRVEGDFGYYSGDVILNDILKVYKIPHSISVIGAEIAPNGLYPNLSPKLMGIAKEMYALENVEPATHTFTHPFYWGKIKDDNLSKLYRLKPKGYQFSLKHELSDTLEFINKNLEPKHKAKEVFWSGDCAPRKNALSYTYKHNILNINGGDTTITKTSPWISLIAPIGLYRDGYTQVYTGAQNENVFTNDWLGPFWGFKRVTQTFELTNSPRRFKPIDIYYHLYSGSKQASLKALRYVFDYAMKQDTMPIFTSEYIPKVMDFYEVSMANEGDEWLFCGLDKLNTLRIEKKDAYADINASSSLVGIKHFENHTYLSLYNNSKKNIYINTTDKKQDTNYMISANGKLVDRYKNEYVETMKFNSYVDLRLNFHIKSGCSLESVPKETKRYTEDESLFLDYNGTKEATVIISCQ